MLALSAAHAQSHGRFETWVYGTPPPVPQAPTTQPFVMAGEPLRSTAGTLGDPFRVLALLPGVASPVPIVPLFVVRGASPGMSGFFIDGMRVPQLFHLLVGAGVVHAGTVDKLEFHPGAYDVTYGRQNGGIAAATTRPARGDRNHLELEWRLFDVSALLELRLPRGIRVSVSGHYGYPGPVIHAIEKKIDLNYWDYQLRIDVGGFTLTALGSYDSEEISLGNLATGVSTPNMHLTFHRVQLRQRLVRPNLDGEIALVGGFDRAGRDVERSVHKLFMGFRANLWRRFSRVSIYAGIDGELSKFHAEGLDLSNLITWTMGNSGGSNSEIFSSQRSYGLGDIGEERVGGTTSAALQLTASLWPDRLELTVGGRVDLYGSNGIYALGFDPRAQLRLRMTDWLSMRIAGGVYQQPPSFPIQLPGIDTFALQLGLQRAVHAAVTENVKLPGQLQLEATGYYQRFDHVTDLPPLGTSICAPPPSELLAGATAELMRLVDGQSYGMEVLLRRAAGRFSGWIAYTLSRSERLYPCGLRPSDYDQNHLLNVVLQVELPRGFRVGARLYVATGRPQTQFVIPNWQDTLRNNVRLPDYVQLDLRGEKTWRLRRVAFTLSLELLNSTFSESALLLSYPSGGPDKGPGVDITMPQVVSFHWLLPSIGLRANL